MGVAFMGKQGRQKFADVWVNQTTLGKQFGLSAIAMGKKLKELGLRSDDGNPTTLALGNGYCTPTPLKDGTPFYMWNRQQVEELMLAHGYQRLDPQEVKARELAESWVQVHKQWQEAVYGVEEELLTEEASDIKKEARRRGLTERVNALLRLCHGVPDWKECAPMRIGSFVPNAALADYFVIASRKDRLGRL